MIFFPNLIVSNLTVINLIVINLPTKLALYIAFSSVIITNSDFALFRPYCKLSTLSSFSYQDKQYNYLTESLDKLPIKFGEIEEYWDILYWLGFKLQFDYFNLCVLHTNAFQKHHIAKE